MSVVDPEKELQWKIQVQSAFFHTGSAGVQPCWGDTESWPVFAAH